MNRRRQKREKTPRRAIVIGHRNRSNSATLYIVIIVKILTVWCKADIFVPKIVKSLVFGIRHTNMPAFWFDINKIPNSM